MVSTEWTYHKERIDLGEMQQKHKNTNTKLNFLSTNFFSTFY